MKNEQPYTDEEFEQEWKAFYPDETKWYHILAVDTEDGYQSVVVNNRLVIEVRPSDEEGYPHDIKGFTNWLLESVKRCIRDIRNGTYMDYVRKIGTNPLATKVKLADLAHNSDTTRLDHEPTEADLKRLQKYQEARKILLQED